LVLSETPTHSDHSYTILGLVSSVPHTSCFPSPPEFVCNDV
jgi:hypothetical protein